MPENAEVNPVVEPKAEFDVGFFTINFLSTDPHGFEVQTRHSLPRRDRDPVTGLPATPLALNQEQRGDLRRGMGTEAFFALPGDFPHEKRPDVRRLFSLIDQTATLKEQAGTTEQLQEKLMEMRMLRKELRPLFKEYNLRDRLGLKVGTRNVQKVGIRKIERAGNKLLIDTRPISYPVYAVASSPDDTEESLDLGAVTGTAGVLITADNKMILQYRSKKNSPYGDMPGASFAGMLDARFKRIKLENGKELKTGVLQDVDDTYIKESSAEERFQEIAIVGEDVTDFRIIGEARDHVREHDEFLLLAKTSLTAREVAKRTENAPRSSNARKLNGQGDFHFEENFLVIDATPEAIETLVTQVKCPRPPTHDAAFIAAGYNMMLERTQEEGGGLKAANEWLERMQEATRQNYEDMNKIVKEFYEQHPEKLEDNKPGKPKRNPNAYEPYYFPTEQGLPDLMNELYRTGLMTRPETDSSPS
ncbi:MAG: hypothetical protein HZC02_01640 [Candidatus Levybacteria bacterium]|nr:hypothetical protein [Candidatus Levybacteria bacterium]